MPIDLCVAPGPGRDGAATKCSCSLLLTPGKVVLQVVLSGTRCCWDGKALDACVRPNFCGPGLLDGGKGGKERPGAGGEWRRGAWLLMGP